MQAAQHPLARPGTATPLREAVYGDVDEQAAALSGWNQSYLQLQAGGFSGRIRRIDLGGLHLFIEDLQASVLQTGCLAEGVLALGVPLRSRAPGLFCGRPCGEDALHVFSGRSGFEFRCAGDHQMLGIELVPTESGLNFGSQAGLRNAAPQALRSLMLNVFETAQARPQSLAEAAVRARMSDALLDRISALSDAPSDEEVSPDGHWLWFSRARELIAADLQQPPTVAQLCEQLGTSRRSLQLAFQRVLGVSPLAYLRAARLGAARRSLKTAASVTEAATQLGFWHFGHFAKDYQAMFGELPSQTHRRHQPPG
ncbi:MAG: helix-turn-helix domain-containing protein [Burkholderiaceae bacterium]|nr:helix-turn-helix domain-containing protein [Burkholderiaceae bacterium]